MTHKFGRLCEDPRVTLLANVALGRDCAAAELRELFDAVCSNTAVLAPA